MAELDTSDWAPSAHYYTRITQSNHAGWVYIMTIMFLCYILIVFVVRFAVKFGKYGHDDWALLASTVSAVGQHVALLAGLSQGMGKSGTLLSFAQLQTVEKYSSAHVFLFFIAHCASKLSTALLTQKLFRTGRSLNKIVGWCLVGVSIFYGLWSIVTLAAACPNPAFPVSRDDQCHDRILRWELVTAVDIATEIILCLAPPLLLAGIRISGAARALVLAVFSVRLGVIVFSAFNLRSIIDLSSDTDVGLAIVPSILWVQTELLWSIIAASVPCLKAFIRPFDKVDEDTWRSTNQRTYTTNRSAGRSWRDPKDDAIPLDDYQGYKHDTPENEMSDDMRMDRVGHNVTISHVGIGSVEDEHRGSWGSQERIIKTQTHWEVRTEHNRGDPLAIE